MEPISKAVILARGLGKRMRRNQPGTHLDPEQDAVASTGAKAMIPIGRPFVDHVVSGLADAGFRDICLVIGPEHGFIRSHFAEAKPRRVRIHYAVQEQPLGTANAVATAEAFAGNDQFLVLNSDNLYPGEVLRALRELNTPGAVMFEPKALVANSNIPAERVRQFAYATVNEAGFLVDLVEKPTALPESDSGLLVSMNCWRFSPEMFGFCRSVAISSRGEFELPEAVRIAIRSGMRLKIVVSRAGVLDLSVRGDIAAVAERLHNLAVNL